MTAFIDTFLCLTDNIGALIHDPSTGRTAAIDAPDAEAVQKALRRKAWRLTDILVTHHHDDHVAGIEALKARWNCRVVAARPDARRIPAVDETVVEGDHVAVGSLLAVVISTPGHTKGHIAYWFEQDRALFAGDTLFSLGCGRLWEGSAADMWSSLLKLRALPDETWLYCGHDYTLANARFALSIDPNNTALSARAAKVEQLHAKGALSLPSRLGDEKRQNPFLRADVPAIALAVGLPGRAGVDIFAELRNRKNKG